MKRYIYALICPISNEIRYIGQTKRTLLDRLKSHIYEYRRSKVNKRRITHKTNWFSKLENLGILDDIKIQQIEICDEFTVDEREIYWISFYENLTNTTTGGSHFTHETMKKISESKTGENNPMYGRVLSNTHKEKILAGVIQAKKNGKYKKTQSQKERISKTQSVFPVLLLNESLSVIKEFPNTNMCALHVGCKKENIKNAIRFKRPIGRWVKKVMWVIRKNEMENNIERIKSIPENDYVLFHKKFGKPGQRL